MSFPSSKPRSSIPEGRRTASACVVHLRVAGYQGPYTYRRSQSPLARHTLLVCLHTCSSHLRGKRQLQLPSLALGASPACRCKQHGNCRVHQYMSCMWVVLCAVQASRPQVYMNQSDNLVA